MLYLRSSKEASIAGIAFGGGSCGSVLECEVRTTAKEKIM